MTVEVERAYTMAKSLEIDSTRPSLERLKALDSLPDITSQLQEVKRLCNHSARADMICKWLLERLKSKSDFRNNPEGWETLLLAFRLLSPQRVALLLSSHGFLSLCRTTLEDETNAKRYSIFLVLLRVLNHLIEVSTGPQGTQLKAVLCASALQAACFLNVWIQSALTLLGIALIEHDAGNEFLRPGVELWNLRKRSVDENDLFASNCLLSILRLLPILNHYEHPRQQKRKRESDQSPQQSYKQILESMLARHVFLPARTAFFKARDATETKARREIGSQEPTFVLRSMLGPLRDGVARENGLRGHQLVALPRLLDVAIRCTPMTTPKQRMREKPWIDAVFQALQECGGDSDSNDEIRQALRDMLSSIKESQAPLSTAVLGSVIEGHSGLGSSKEIDWNLISLVVQIDGDVFVEEEKAAMLFADITRVTGDRDEPRISSLERCEPPVQIPDKDEKFLDLLRTQIIAPVMRAFANQRKLGTFVEMWATQINTDGYDFIPVVWTGLEAQFAPLLEESLTTSQILEIFDRYSAPLRSVGVDPTSGDSKPWQSTLRASIVILDAVYEGIHSEALTDALYKRLGDLLEVLLGTRASQSLQSSDTELKPFPLPMEPQSWTLMIKAFESWFPAWTMAQSDASVVAVKGTEIVRSRAFAVATLKTSALAPSTQHAADAFVVCLCSYLLPYDRYDDVDGSRQHTFRDSCLQGMSFLTDLTPGHPEWGILLQFPQLVTELLSAEEFPSNMLIRRVFLRSVQKYSLPMAAGRQISLEQAMLTTVLQRGNAAKVEDLVASLSRCISQQTLTERAMMDIEEPDSIIQEWNEIKMLEVLSGLSPESFSRAHREKLIGAICQQQQDPESSGLLNAESAQNLRFAFLIRLMKLPNATAKLAVDPNELWGLIASYSSGNDGDLMPHLEEMISLLINHLLATQDQERSRSVLVSLSHGIKERIESIYVQSELVDLNRTLGVVKTLISHLEIGSKESLKLQLVHRTPDLIKGLLDVCLNSISSKSTQLLARMLGNDLQPVLKMLLAIPESLVMLSGTDTGSWHTPLSGLTQCCMDLLDGNTDRNIDEDYDIDNDDEAALKLEALGVLVEAFRVLCKISRGDNIPQMTILAINIIKQYLTVSTRNSVMTSFCSYVEKLPQSQYSTLLDRLLDSLQDELGSISVATLPLLEVCASRKSQTVAAVGELRHVKLLSTLMTTITNTQDTLAQKHAIGCTARTLKGNSSLVNQYGIELTMQTLHKVLDDRSAAQVVYLDICQVLSTILLQYRSRLHGRLHLVVQIFQALLSQLFLPADSSNITKNGRRKPTLKHAQTFSKLLTLLCEPPQFKNSSKSSSLVDESRKEQAYVGKSVQYILHHYCSQILAGKLGPGMREAVTPGLWSIIEAMEMSEAEGIKSLSAAMNNSERAVLRGVYDDWRRFGKWRGA